MPWEADQPASGTTTSTGLADTMWDLINQVVPVGAFGQGTPPSNFGFAPVDYMTGLAGLTAPLPHLPSQEGLEAGRTTARHGLPIAGGAVGSAAGGIPGSMALSGLGETLGQYAAGEANTDPMRVGGSTAMGAVTLPARLGTAGARMAGQAIHGDDAYAAAMANTQPVALTELAGKANSLLADLYARYGTATKAWPAEIANLAKKLALFGGAAGRTQSLKGAAQIRQDIGSLGYLKSGGEKFGDAGALYGALMSDLRQAAAAGNADAAGFLKAIANDYIERGLFPQGAIERLAGWGLAGATSTGNVGAMLPFLGAIGARSINRTPWSLAEPVTLGLGQISGRELLWPEEIQPSTELY
jgi:hypothetical protein